MKISSQRAWKVLGLVLLGVMTFFTMSYLVRRPEPGKDAIRTDDSSGAPVTQSRNIITVPGSRPTPKTAPITSDPDVLSAGSIHCSTMELIGDTLEIKATAKYLTKIPQARCFWAVRVFRAGDNKKPVFEKKLPSILLKPNQDHSIELDEKLAMPVPLTAGEYRIVVELYRNSPRDRPEVSVLSCKQTFDVK